MSILTNKYIEPDDISYVWVTKGGSIPHKEKTHGMLNIINTAQKNPDSQINVYIDSEQNHISYTLRPNITQPKNIKFIPVSHLVTECIIRAKINRHNPNFINEAYQLYFLEMEYGHPAYAGNFIKFLALYKGGFVSDIGAIYDKKIFSDLKCLPLVGRIINGLIDYRFHYATPSVLLWSSENQNETVYEAIKYMNNYYQNRDLSLSCFEENIDILENKKIKNEIYKIYAYNPISKQYNVHNNYEYNAISAIKSGKLALNTGYKFQDNGYSGAISFGNECVKIEPSKINHKISHLTASIYNNSKTRISNDNERLEENARYVRTRTGSLNEPDAYKFLAWTKSTQSINKDTKYPDNKKVSSSIFDRIKSVFSCGTKSDKYRTN